VWTAAEMGWSRLVNGDLLAEAEEYGFDVMITADQNLEYQQNLKGRKLALVVLSTNRISVLEKYSAQLAAATDAVTEGSYQFIRFELPPKSRKTTEPL
jgi:hypothetical protein